MMTTLSRTLAFLFMLAPLSPAALWEVGKPFPDLTLPTIDGETSLSLADFRGEKVMLHVFASW